MLILLWLFLLHFFEIVLRKERPIVDLVFLGGDFVSVLLVVLLGGIAGTEAELGAHLLVDAALERVVELVHGFKNLDRVLVDLVELAEACALTIIMNIILSIERRKYQKCSKYY